MGSLERIPCVNVDSSNFQSIWSYLISSIGSASWIALDLELSGIGSRRNFGINNVEERYQAFIEVIKTRSVLSIGLSTFEHVRCAEPVAKTPAGDEVSSSLKEWHEEIEKVEESTEWSYLAKSFNILVRCTEPFELEEDAEKFLKNHGFDFDRQKSHGIPYSKSPEEVMLNEVSIKRLFVEMLMRDKPLVLHNGFIDLLFLYQHFFLNLPNSIYSFVADVQSMFTAGVYDTKYITEKVLDMESSFLEFVFYNRQRYNVERFMKEENHIYIYFEDQEQDCLKGYTEIRSMKTKILEDADNIEVCRHYSRHGWCVDGIECKKSHNIDLILDRCESKKLRARTKTGKRSSRKTRKIILKMKQLSLFNESIKEGDSGDSDDCQSLKSGQIETKTATIDQNLNEQSKNGSVESATSEKPKHEVGRVKSGAHRSGYDAFMTGYSFGTFLYTHCSHEPTLNGTLNSRIAGLKDLVNNIFLSGKDHPLKIRSSNYSKPSPQSLEKLYRLRKSFISHSSVK